MVEIERITDELIAGANKVGMERDMIIKSVNYGTMRRNR